MKLGVSVKHEGINKAQSTTLVVVIVCTVVTIFCLIGSKALLSQAAYQNKVESSHRASLVRLQTAVSSASQLINQYTNVFEGTNPTNIIGGQNTTSPTADPPNGDNARIVLDALPSDYDYPALITSLNSIATNDGIGSPSITGGLQITGSAASTSPDPQPIPIPITISGTADYATSQKFINDLERSIRTINVTTLSISGTQSAITFNITADTYYQPAKVLTITNQAVQ